MNRINLKQQIFLQKFKATNVLGGLWNWLIPSAGRKINKYCTLILLLVNSRALDMIIITTINGQFCKMLLLTANWTVLA